jgi:hypothetical protein
MSVEAGDIALDGHGEHLAPLLVPRYEQQPELPPESSASKEPYTTHYWLSHKDNPVAMYACAGAHTTPRERFLSRRGFAAASALHVPGKLAGHITGLPSRTLVILRDDCRRKAS